MGPSKLKKAFKELPYVRKLKLLQQYSLINHKRDYHFWSDSGIYYSGQLPPPPKFGAWPAVWMALIGTLASLLLLWSLPKCEGSPTGTILGGTSFLATIIATSVTWGFLLQIFLEWREARRSPNP